MSRGPSQRDHDGGVIGCIECPDKAGRPPKPPPDQPAPYPVPHWMRRQPTPRPHGTGPLIGESENKPCVRVPSPSFSSAPCLCSPLEDARQPSGKPDLTA